MKNEKYIKRARKNSIRKEKLKNNSIIENTNHINIMNNQKNNIKELNHQKNGKNAFLKKIKSKNLICFDKHIFNKYNSPNKKFSNIILLIIVIFIIKTFSEEIKIRKLESISEIVVKIRGEGYQYILNPNFTKIPDEVIVNNINQTINKSSLYKLTNETNVIILNRKNEYLYAIRKICLHI